MVAGVTIEFRILRPHVALSPPDQTQQMFPQLDGLSRGQRPDSNPWVFVQRFFPMARHYGREGIQLEVQIRMACGNHLMVDELLLVAQMAGEAFLASLDNVAGIVHAQLDRLIEVPIAGGMWTEPVGGRSMAIFAAHAIIAVEGPGALGKWYIQRMARQAFGRRFRVWKT